LEIKDMENITINLMQIVDGTSTNDEGSKLYRALVKELTKGSTVNISLQDATPMSSSFLNSSFGEIYSKFGMELIREKIKLVNYKPTQAERIKEYFKIVSA